MSSSRQTTAQIGGLPTVSVDVPICAVFIAIFLALGATHMTIMQVNRRRGHKFWFNYLCFGFSMSRVLACIFRIAWAKHPTNVDVSLVASIFLGAGILVIYVINNVLAWRMVRSAAPNLGWHRVPRMVNKILLWSVLGLFVPSIVTTVLRVKRPTMDHVQTASKVLSRLAQTYFLIMAIGSAFLLALAVYQAKIRGEVTDPFGRGSWNSKISILSISITLATVEAGFRCGTTWSPARLASRPAWWDSKPAFYCFNFALDVCILVLLAATRIDRRLHVPDGANGPMSYSVELADPETNSVKDERSDCLAGPTDII